MKNIILLIVIVLSFIACDDIVGVTDISDEQVTVLAPSNSAILNVTALTFSWQAVEGAENYHIQIALPAFSEALQIVKDTMVTSTSFLTSLEADNYEWRVRAENYNYNTEYTIQSFTIEE